MFSRVFLELTQRYTAVVGGLDSIQIILARDVDFAPYSGFAIRFVFV
jgi:hypothetical protein